LQNRTIWGNIGSYCDNYGRIMGRQMDNDTFESRIKHNLENLSPKHKRLAKFVLDNQYYVSFASASKAATKTGTSPATVVRFAQTLGYTGYSELQSALRKELPRNLTAVERLESRLGEFPKNKHIAHKVFAADICNIEQTAQRLSGGRLERAADQILKADKIFVVGSGLSEGSALYLVHSLKVIGLDARPILGGGMVQAIDLAHLKEGSVVIAISMWRYVRSTYKAVLVAAKAGIPTIAITDSILSPLAEKATYAFEVATDNIDHSLSPTAVISFINALVAVLSFKAPEKALESLRRVDRAYRDDDLLMNG
jgi:DNA-binding MurR/RpiR family transcriptional regulator